MPTAYQDKIQRELDHNPPSKFANAAHWISVILPAIRIILSQLDILPPKEEVMVWLQKEIHQRLEDWDMPLVPDRIERTKFDPALESFLLSIASQVYDQLASE